MNLVKKYYKKCIEFLKISRAKKIAERYFTMNVFDSIMIMLGILIANFFAEIYDVKITITACFGAAIAMTISGIWGAYITERAERKGEVKKIEDATSLDLKGSPIEKAHKFASVILALVNGLSPLITAFIILLPMFFSDYVGVVLAYEVSIAIALITLFYLGAFLGKISKENVILYGFEMVFVGLICIAIIILLGL
jgi:predicted membrane protein (TIGR00267 family)